MLTAHNPVSHIVCIFSNYSDNYALIEHVLPVQCRGKVSIIPQAREPWGSFQMSRCTLHPGNETGTKVEREGSVSCVRVDVSS